jgi:hypothetical protein
LRQDCDCSEPSAWTRPSNRFETAARLAPRNVDYVTAREMTRQQIVFDHLERGNAEMLKGRQIEALAAFRSALRLDPQNEVAQ